MLDTAQSKLVNDVPIYWNNQMLQFFQMALIAIDPFALSIETKFEV